MMLCEPKKFPIRELVAAWNDSSLKINTEYQRGATWKTTQMQGLVDSVFRQYPLPPVFLHQITAKGLGGKEATRFEVVDGQQRIRAFAEFFADKFTLLSPDDKQLRLPNSLRKVPAPWGTRLYSQLDQSQKQLLDDAQLDAFVITQTTNADEIRDLFIRLQSGTALNRQQVRDAWPGNLGPFIESLAGKLNRQPSFELFGLIDRRSDKGDDDVDRFTVNRQVCAQLLTLFIARTKDPLAVQNIGADDLDRAYHSNTEFDPNGALAVAFKQALGITASFFKLASSDNSTGKSKLKFKKMDVLAAFFLVQDLSSPLFKFDAKLIETVAKYIKNTSYTQKTGKSVSGRAINAYYEEWRKDLPKKLGIHLDPQRFFDAGQKIQIHKRDKGECQICKNVVNKDSAEDAEYDHYPTPHYLGGKTSVENGRLVCTKCHPRGPTPDFAAED